MEKKNSGGMNIGTSSILVTFVLLCLVTFAALSYMSARSDYQLSRQAAQRTAEYYDANRMAEIYMANIEGLLTKHFNSCNDESDYYAGIEKLFSDNDNISVSTTSDETIIEYKVVISQSQDLLVALEVNYPDSKNGNLFSVKKWSTQTNADYINSLKKEKENGGMGLMF